MNDHTMIDAGGIVLPGAQGFTTLLATIAAGAAERDRERIHPYAEIETIRRARLGALRLPHEDGGGGLSLRELFGAVIRLGEADPNVAHILRNHYVFVERFAQGASDEPHRRWQRAVSEGAIFGLANTELEQSQAGANSATQLSRDGSNFRLNGKKYYSTGCLYADYIIVRAKDEQDRPVSAIIPAAREGVTLVDDWDGAGQRLTGTGTTLLENVAVAADEVVFDAPGAAYGLPYASSLSQLYLTAVSAGIIAAVLADAKALLHRRAKTFYFASAANPAEDPLLQQVVGQMACSAFVAETVVLAAAEAQDQLLAKRLASGGPEEEASMQGALLAAQAKITVDELATRVSTAVFDLGGASSTKRIYNLDRHWRNARTLASHNPGLYKARSIGDLILNGTPLPKGGFF